MSAHVSNVSLANMQSRKETTTRTTAFCVVLVNTLSRKGLFRARPACYAPQASTRRAPGMTERKTVSCAVQAHTRHLLGQFRAPRASLAVLERFQPPVAMTIIPIARLVGRESTLGSRAAQPRLIACCVVWARIRAAQEQAP